MSAPLGLLGEINGDRKRLKPENTAVKGKPVSEPKTSYLDDSSRSIHK